MSEYLRQYTDKCGEDFVHPSVRPCGLGFYRFGFYRFGQKTKIIGSVIFGSVHKASLSVRFELGSVLNNEQMQCHSHETSLKPVFVLSTEQIIIVYRFGFVRSGKILIVTRFGPVRFNFLNSVLTEKSVRFGRTAWPYPSGSLPK
jgi:hypothetical protein